MAQKLRDKTVFPQSPTTTFRERTPTSPDIANRGLPNMAIDFSRQQRVMPDSLTAPTRYPNDTPRLRSMNASGRPKALDVMVGGSPEPRASNKETVMQRQKLSRKEGR